MAAPDGCAQQDQITGSAPAATAATARVTDSPPDVDRSKLALELLFEGNLTDTSSSRCVGTARGSVTFVEGRRGKCASFDGHSWVDSGFMQTGLGDEFTVECWVNPVAQQSPHADICGNHASAGLGFVLQQDGSNTNEFLAAYGAGDGKWVTTEAVPLLAGRWQHIALVKGKDELRLYLNGIQVAARQDLAPVRPSPMPVAVGNGYEAQPRCFRGLVDEFRIWNKAQTVFPHAGIDLSDARETLARYVGAASRPTADELVESWTLATDDTRLTIGVTDAGEMVVRELSCPAVDWNWISNPVAFGLWSQVDIAGRSKPLRWRFVNSTVDDNDGRTLTLRFASDDPTLEVASQWHAHLGRGPIRHSMQITNRSSAAVTISEQPTFDLDLAGGTVLWSFHSDGGTPDAVGVYRQQLKADQVGRRYTVRTVPTGEFIPYVVLDASQRHGVYLGLEWSYCRIESVLLTGGASPSIRFRAGNIGDLRAELDPGETIAVRPGFVGAYHGDIDDAGNSLRRWLIQNCMPDVLRQNTGYPKVQWNAFGATGKAPGSWDPVETRYYPLIDDIAPLGFEEVMIDVGWWQGSEPDSDQADWPSGMRKAADYAHEKGLRFGLYWTDDCDMASPAGRQKRADRVTRLFREYHADMWRSDSTRGNVLGNSHAATAGFYAMVDALSEQIPGFQWENCSGGGRIKDYGAMRRAVKIFNSDTYSALHVRQAFYDSSHALHPMQIEGHLGSVDGRYRPGGVVGIRYAFRSISMGAPEWFLDAPNGGNGTEPWTQQEKDALKACVETYKTRIRPLVRNADLYHVFPRPDGSNRDGLEYYDPVAGKGVVFVFQPARGGATDAIRLRGLDPQRTYSLSFEDGTHPPCIKPASELMHQGLPVVLPGDEVSELIFFEVAPRGKRPH